MNTSPTKKQMHFVILRFSSLGDVVMQMSYVSWLKYIDPNCYITFITMNSFTSLIEGHPHIDHVIGYEKASGIKDLKNLKSLGKNIHDQRPIDYIIDLHGTTRSYFFKFLLPHVPCLNLDKRRFERFLIVKFKINLMKKMETLHERNLIDIQRVFGESYNRVELEHFLNQQTNLSKRVSLITSPKSFVEDEFESPVESDYVVFAPVASFDPKRWPIENFFELAKKVLSSESLKKISIIVLAGPHDDYCQIFNTLEVQYPNRFKNLQGETKLSETSRVIRHSQLVIGNDTGLGHIAESFGVNTITIFGPTTEDFGFRPHLAGSEVLSSDVWCRPCSTTGKKKCFRSKQFCMENVTIDRVYATIEKRFSN